MHKSILTFGLLASSLVMLAVMPIINNNSFLNSAIAQGYDANYGDNYYSTYPTDDKKYECQKGPFEGFFVSSVEFCKFKFDDSKRDNKAGPPDSGNNNSTLVNTFNCINPNVININTDNNTSSAATLGTLQQLQGSDFHGLNDTLDGLGQIDLNKNIINLCIITDNDNIVIEGSNATDGNDNDI